MPATFSQRYCTTYCSPRGRTEDRRSHGRDAGSERSWQTRVTRVDLQGHAAASVRGAALVPMSLVLLLGRAGVKTLAIEATLVLYRADMRFSPGCLKWKFIKVWVRFLKACGSQVRVVKLPGSSEVLCAEGVSKQRCCVPLVVSISTSDFLRRAPGKLHFPKCAARSEMLVGWW